MKLSFSRRDFLKLSGAAIAGLALSPELCRAGNASSSVTRWGRVALEGIFVYSSPTSASVKKKWIRRDTVIELLEDVESLDKSLRNQRWYRIDKGYVHSAYVQPVRKIDNIPCMSLSAEAVLGEITHPYAQSVFYSRSRGWQPLYRLYYGSLHWITDCIQIDDGEAVYQITDHDLHVNYFVPARTVRLMHSREYEPFSADMHSKDEKRIVISIKKQTLTAYEGDRVVLKSDVSTGVRSRNLEQGDIPTETPIGDFRVYRKCPAVHMGNRNLTSDVLAYELPGVPWVMYFNANGVALHGTYWHDNFGIRMSHGCVNLPNDISHWLYCWTTPVAVDGWFTTGEGTPISVVAV